ncbi:hypothetical protein GGI04_004801 [Coemansia thaxteri]|nr:hypothetical protein GGI04_004801 [Coemansia thaxteri]
MSPVGERLRTVKTVAEFITVVCDAMRCHQEILTRCNILHRDISDNNVLVVKRDGKARGLLIDFDCAEDLSKEKTDRRAEMTGTFPFMSINNLSGSDVQRTSLDDWESVLYLICWYATIGIEHGTRRRKELEELPIMKWRTGKDRDVAEAKQASLQTEDLFQEHIVRNFNENDKDGHLLKNLVLNLRAILFENPNLGTEYHGTSTMVDIKASRSKPMSMEEHMEEIKRQLSGQATTDRGSSEQVNPFQMRASKCADISSTLLMVTEVYWKAAIEIQSNYV